MHHDKTSLNPYLTFPGNCAEAMNFYKEALNGELEIIPFEDSPMEVPDDYKQKVMHATLTFGYALIMASDGQPDHEVTNGNSIHLSLSAISEKEGQTYFNNLSAGGQVIMPFEKAFWGAKFGMIVDKYGISWMVNVEMEEVHK